MCVSVCVFMYFEQSRHTKNGDNPKQESDRECKDSQNDNCFYDIQ